MPKLALYNHSAPPIWGTTISGDKIYAGGFSGLHFIGKTKEGHDQFVTTTDRGPNSEPTDIPHIGKGVRVFLLPNFQPRILVLECDNKTNSFKIVREILLTDPHGKPLSGRPQWYKKEALGSDEMAVDLNAQPLDQDPMGIDTEAIAVDSEGHFWLGEEYRPSLLKFSASGKLIKRYIPKNSLPIDKINNLNSQYGQKILVEGLPERYRHRRVNRGFEGLTFANNKIYAQLQSPLELSEYKDKKLIPIIEFDIATETAQREFHYPLKYEGVDKIGDLTYSKERHVFLTIEQNSKTGARGQHMITEFSLNEKVDEKMPLTSEVLNPKLIVRLEDIGYNFAEKVEGLAWIDNQHLAIINDNDFGVNGEYDFTQKRVSQDPQKKSVLGILDFSH